MRTSTLTVIAALATLTLSVGCFPTEGDDGEGDGGGTCTPTTQGCACGASEACAAGLVCTSGLCTLQTLDWNTSSCSELGFGQTGAGACYRACGNTTECDHGTECCNIGYQPYCRLGRNCGDSCLTHTDCGPTGWTCLDGACYLGCTVDTSGEQSSECPTPYACGINPDNTYHCSMIDEPTSCGGPCPTGCCSPSGLSCCSPPFCGGDCVGSPCC